MDLALVINPSKPSALSVLSRIRKCLGDGKHRLRVWEPPVAELRARADYGGELDFVELTTDMRQSDVVVALGGDGTLLQAVHLLEGAERPLLGINLGSLGFLTDTPQEDVEGAFERLLAGNYRLDSRMLIEAEHVRAQRAHVRMTALNEVVLAHGSVAGLLEISMRAAGVDLGSMLADGIIVATPSGSTAYSLSAGGPVVSPRLRALVVTPISAHMLSMRPLVVGAEELLELGVVGAPSDTARVTIDGRPGCEMRTGERLLVRRAPRDLQLVVTRDTTFYDTLRAKLGWGRHGRTGGERERG